MTSLPAATNLGVATVNPQPVNQPTNNERTTQQQRALKIIKKLGIAEVAMGWFCFILGAIILGYTEHYNKTTFRLIEYHYIPVFYKPISFGEGIWCGIWIIIAGALGIFAGNKNPTPCRINSHLAFSIVGAIFAAVLSIVPIGFSVVGIKDEYYRALTITLSFVAFATMILLIVSASYCCLASQSCCQGGDSCCYPTHQPRVTYVVTSAPVQGQNQISIPEIQGHPLSFQPQAQRTFYVVQQPPSQQQQQQQPTITRDFQATNVNEYNNSPAAYENTAFQEQLPPTAPSI